MRTRFVFLGKLIVSALAFIVGLVFGGFITTTLGMQAPTLPPEVDTNTAMLLMFATSPLLVLALYFVNGELAGGWLARGAVLFLLSWIAYSVNNVIEATVFTSYKTASWFTIINFLPAIALSALTTAALFPAQHSDKSMLTAWQEFFRQRTPRSWVWRLLVAGVIFMPIYYLFGMLVVPFVGEYYQQGAAGLTVPGLSTLLLVLLGRSLLFLIACLPVVAAWQGGRIHLVFALGLALFILVGLLYMLSATWIAPTIRFVHSLEILADSLLYAGALVWLCTRPHTTNTHPPRTLEVSYEQLPR